MNVRVGVKTNGHFLEFAVNNFQEVFEINPIDESKTHVLNGRSSYITFAIKRDMQYSFVGDSTSHISGDDILYICFEK